MVSQIAGALAAALTTRHARIDQQRCVILATHARDPAQLPPPAVLAGSTGQGPVARGCRWLQDPQLFAASRSLQPPERLMALRLVMTVGLLVYAAVADRLRQALQDHAATFPDPQGKRRQHPTARWVLPDLVGIPWRCQAGPWPMVRTLTAAHQPLRRLRGQPSMPFDDVRYS